MDIYQEENGQMTFLKEQAKQKSIKRYYFCGPVYIRDKKVASEQECNAYAKSMKQAINNIKYYLSKYYNCNYNSVFFDISQIKEV